MVNRLRKKSMKTDSNDDITRMIEKHAGDTPLSLGKMEEAMVHFNLY